MNKKIINTLLLTITVCIFVCCKSNKDSYYFNGDIQSGSWLWIDKFSYGGRLPERWADIPLVNVFTHIALLRNADTENNWGYRRLPGFAKPEAGDIVVFNSPENEERLLVKRITEIRSVNGMIMYYLMGDNRGHSHDSRVFGWIPERLIVGKVHLSGGN